MISTLFAIALVLCASLSSQSASVPSPPPPTEIQPPAASSLPLGSDETLILFPSRAVREKAANGSTAPGWVIHLRGWVFEREEDSRWRNAAIDRIGQEMGLTNDEIKSEVFRARVRSFLADNERGKRIEIEVAGRTFLMPATGEDGHFQDFIRLTDAELLAAAGNPDPNKPRQFKLTVKNEGGAEVIIAPTRIVEPGEGRGGGLLVVCDIDDTIKVSNIDDRDNLLRMALLEPYRPVPGMSELLTKLAAAGKAGGNPVEFHYLSASPWQLYEPLAAFLHDNGFPDGCITLREFRMKDGRIANLFEDPTEYKLAELARLAAQMPDRKLVLIGDSTEHDAELYAEFARKHPGRVEMIAIRATPGDAAGRNRAESALKDLPGDIRTIVFDDPASVRLDVKTPRP